MASQVYGVDQKGRVVVPINSFSDGDPSVWPLHSNCMETDPTVYLEKLGTQWMKARGECEQDTIYILDQLPEGYVYFARPRQSRPELVDKFLWGHPSGKYYFSPNRFWPHFIYLMNGGSEPCECEHCGPVRKVAIPREPSKPMARKRRPVGISRNALNDQIGLTRPQPSRPKRTGRKKFLAIDAEGNQDVFKEMVYRLNAEGTLNKPISEDSNMEWRAERKLIKHHLTRMRMQHSFFPRLGELVLWFTEPSGEIKFHWHTQTYQIYSAEEEKFMGIPKWCAGVVTQVPEQPLNLHDAIVETDKEHAVNMSGFRIELFPDPNSPDKSLSTQYKYVPLCQIRPLNFWSVYLQGIDPAKFHCSIPHALTIMSSFSMLDKYHFDGVWPTAYILCEGIYLGAELLIRGDGVRLMPLNQAGEIDVKRKVTDVLVIDTIELKLTKCDANLQSPFLCEAMAARLRGKVYTMDPELAFDPSTPMTEFEVSKSFECTGMREYGSWYPRYEPGHVAEVSLNRVIGRCFESEYMDVMFDNPALDIDIEGVTNGRLYGRETDDRIAPGKDWLLADYRLQQLALESLNGIEHSRYDDTRDPKMYRAIMNIINNEAVGADHRNSKIVRQLGRAYGGLIGSRSGYTAFDNAGKHSSMVATALGGGPAASYDNAGLIETSTNTGVDEADDGDEDSLREIAASTDSGDDVIAIPVPKRRRQM
ncbi:hypothetical protein MGYG_07425 [Nannizzia gypsea CBS 118893]|uniref:Cryptic loci regulator 2 N-terminal domain-containing protein n=1 Tax=Arthroderma gypseum (strain ATCC MYA-4604 / CBS 118893) TaxID=535722 RepID=E4V344_ARTGP|nr:hypothetical protein MGYG_07425 [Nannizzia gypsea CBS 118893]EFR04418.1 hypothetical protein MGYG_07425 [Nannizzia gypsea CBS 118893]